MKVMTPVDVVRAMKGLEPRTSEWQQAIDAIQNELLEFQRIDPIGIGRNSMTAMFSLLQLDVIAAM